MRVAAVVGVTVFLLGYALALNDGFGGEYLRSPSVSLALIGSVGGMVLLLWGAKYHLKVWEDVRRCFAVSDEAYDDLVEPVLKRAYDSRRFFTEYLFALILTVVINWELHIPIPYAITVDSIPQFAPNFYLSLINYLYGAVVLFIVIAGVHGGAHFLSLAARITDLPLRNVDTAADRLEPIAKFSIFVSTSVFAGVILLLIVYSRLIAAASGQVDAIIDYALVVILVIAGLIFAGVLVFWLPQMAIHARLTEAKQDRLSAINDEYVALSERSQKESESVDHITTELAVLDARRRNVNEVETWAYNLPSLLPLVGSGVASTILWIIQFMNQIS